ncbi:hypothetical protein MHYP_G00007980 [Metynnis hypsauchen]
MIILAENCRKLHKHHHKDAAEDHSLHVNQAEDNEALNYAALSFTQSSSSRRSRTKNSSDQPVYAQVASSNCPVALEHFFEVAGGAVDLGSNALSGAPEVLSGAPCSAQVSGHSSQSGQGESSSSTIFMLFPGPPPYPMNLVQERNNGAQYQLHKHHHKGSAEGRTINQIRNGDVICIVFRIIIAFSVKQSGAQGN